MQAGGLAGLKKFLRSTAMSKRLMAQLIAEDNAARDA